jgi:hypothetical protein
MTILYRRLVETCRMMLDIKKPMLGRSDYYLVSGYREWQLALYKLDKTQKIYCQVVSDASELLLNELAWHDAYGAALLYGISPTRIPTFAG